MCARSARSMCRITCFVVHHSRPCDTQLQSHSHRIARSTGLLRTIVIVGNQNARLQCCHWQDAILYGHTSQLATRLAHTLQQWQSVRRISHWHSRWAFFIARSLFIHPFYSTSFLWACDDCHCRCLHSRSSRLVAFPYLSSWRASARAPDSYVYWINYYYYAKNV